MSSAGMNTKETVTRTVKQKYRHLPQVEILSWVSDKDARKGAHTASRSLELISPDKQ